MTILAIQYPPEDEKTAQETRKALDWGKTKVSADGSKTSLSDVIWRLLQDAADTLARLPDRERGWLLSADRASWPEIYHSARERWEAEQQRLVDLKESPEEIYLPRLGVTDPTAIPRMLTVLGWLQHVRARTPHRQKRDKLVVLALAQGQSLKSVRRLMLGECTDRAIYMVRSKVLGQITSAICESS